MEEQSNVGKVSETKEGSKLEKESGMEGTKVLPDQKFFLADPSSEWYEHLSRGRCDQLLRMVKEDPGLLKQKGKGNVSVLHKAVHHKHVDLVRHVVEGMFDNRGISTHFGNQLTLEDLLCEKDDREITAVMLAAVIGPWEGIGIFQRAVLRCDNEQKRDACDQDTIANQINCSCLLSLIRYRMPRLRRVVTTIRAFVRFKAVIRNVTPPWKSAPLKYRYVIEPIVRSVLVENDENVMLLKTAFRTRADYNCAPRTEELFFHFLCGCCELRGGADGPYELSWEKTAASVARKIVDKILERSDAEDCMFDLFDYLDPQGRTPLHVAGMASYEVHQEYNISNGGITAEVLRLIPRGTVLYDRCVSVRDGAGRTIFHQSCILKDSGDWKQLVEDGRVDLDARVDLNEREDWKKRVAFNPKDNNYGRFGPLVHHLLHWRSPGANLGEDIPLENSIAYYPTALHLLILYGHEDVFQSLLEQKGQHIDVNARLQRGGLKSSFTPVQVAAALGHEKMVDILLKHSEVKDNGKLHGPRDEADKYSAIHVAAAYKRLKVLQTFLENKEIYDPMIANTAGEQESPLHLVALTRKLPDPIMLEDTLLLEGDGNIRRRCLHKYKDLGDDKLQKNYDANDIVCINTMLQIGFDIWCSDKDGREPYPGVDASIEAYNWWYDRVAAEVSNYKQKLNSAIGAISVIATLVATASFIGPLQPPLGYDSIDGSVQSHYVLVRMYFVCNVVSFYFAVASLLAAITPTVPMLRASMLRESTQDEIRRSQRSSKIAMSLLLISIVAILLSFSSSSIVVMRPLYGYDRMVIYRTIGVGAAICMVTLVLFTLRMVGQILYQPYLIKRFWSFRRSLHEL